MGVREAVVILVVGVATQVVAAPQDDITLTTSGYRGVTVAISDQLDESKCVQYINSIKAMVEAGSQLMFDATGGKVFFGDVVIVVPENWSCQGQTKPANEMVYSWDSAHLRVGPSHYLFGDNPWTQQLGGCGEPGDWIYLPDNFLLNNSNVGSPGSILVHEWAKYRWGVFEEYGHAYDPIFPPAYHAENNSITPTYCTDHLLEGSMYCSEGATEAECQFIPNLTQNATITSSLLAAPFLDTVINFCDSVSHNAAAPTKHNLLCDQSSAMDVMGRHADMMGSPGSLANTNFTVVKAAADWPRIVLLVEYTALMRQNQDQQQQVLGRWEQLAENVRHFINEEAAADSYMGVVLFGSTLNASPILPLTQSNRKNLAGYIPDALPGPAQGKKNLYMAIQRGAELLGPAGGTLVLLTQNLEEYTDTQNLVEAAANNPVWPILYPCDTQVPTSVYQQLADISPDTYVLTVPNTVFKEGNKFYQSVDTSADLHYSLLTATASPATRVARGSCVALDCTIPLEMNDNTVYTSQAYVKVFCSISDVNYVTVTVTDPNGGNLGTATMTDTNILLEVRSLQTGRYQVSISFTANAVAELWAIPAPLDLQVSVWSPKGLHNLPYSPGFAPRLLAKVTNNASWLVLFADVTAQVANKIINQESPVNITLNDIGTGGDVTGQDGVYSGYLVGFEPKNDVTITLTVTDNNGRARVVNPTLRAAPTITGNVACCGSQLNVSMLQLEDPGRFEFSSSTVSGRFTGVKPGTLPPGQVTDLQALRNGYDVALTFTAPGAHLDQGQAQWYLVNAHVAGEDLLIGNISGLPAGSSVEGQVSLQVCDKVYTLTVVAYFNGVYGSTSNSVREVVSCNEPPSGNLKGGAIAGIIIGCILVVLLILLIIYLCLNRDHLSDLWVWKILTCRCCCKNSKDDDLYNAPSQARRSDVIRSNSSPSKPVRNLTDLYSRPNVGVRMERRQDRDQDEDDGGFGERQRQQDKVQRRAPDLADAESQASSSSTMPINKVGLPVGSDNHAYDDGPYTIYRNAPPVPRYPSANTQV